MEKRRVAHCRNRVVVDKRQRELVSDRLLGAGAARMTPSRVYLGDMLRLFLFLHYFMRLIVQLFISVIVQAMSDRV
jgi:hypothetical protein